MIWAKRALIAGALTFLASVAPACMGHTQTNQGTGGSGDKQCSVFHPDAYRENHPNPGVSHKVPGAETSGSAICR